MKFLLSITFCLCISMQALCQQSAGQVSASNYPEKAQKEAQSLSLKYALNQAQKDSLGTVLLRFYQSVAVLNDSTISSQQRSSSLSSIKAKREADIQTVLTAQQYVQYVQDRNAMLQKVQQRMDSLRQQQTAQPSNH